MEALFSLLATAALNNLALNAKDNVDEELDSVMDKLNWYSSHPTTGAFTVVKAVCFPVMIYNLKVPKNKLAAKAKELDTKVEELDVDFLDMMSSANVFFAALGIGIAIIDVLLQCCEIAHVVKQTKEIKHKLETVIKGQYKDFFDGIKNSAIAFKAAVASSENSASIED